MLKTIRDAFKMLWLGTGDSISLKIRLVTNFVCGLASGALLYLSTYYLSVLVKSVAGSDMESVKKYLILLIFASLGLVAIRFVYRYFTEFIGKYIVNNIKKHYYKRIFYKNYHWHLHNSVGYFSSMLDKVTSIMMTWSWQMSYDFLPGFALTALFFGYTYFVSPYLFLYFIICTIFLIIGISFSYVGRRAKLMKENSITERSFAKTFVDFLYNIRSIKKMNLLKFSTDKINEKTTAVENKYHEMMEYNAYQWLFMEFFVRAQFFAPLVYFVYKLINTGQGVEVIVMLASVQSQMGEIGRQIMHFISPVVSAKQDFDLLSEHMGKEEKNLKEEKTYNKNWKEILFRNTYFDFNNDGNIFRHHVNDFKIKRGDHIAVMGQSGQGKSTFFNLLTRQYKAKSGNIMLDDVDYHNVAQSFFDNEFTYISQDIELFDMTFYDNITMGKKVSRKKFQEIVDGCCLNELVTRMGNNPHTDIGEKGIKVSGGEKQRINLARGLLLGRDILVLDEITANLDPKTTKKIWQFIFKNYKNKTIIAISHEPELIKHVNKKLIFEKGYGIYKK